MMVKWLIAVLAAVPFFLNSCIDDSVSTSPAHQPEFSVDTLRLGRVFTGQQTPTYRFTVYNRHDKIITLESVSVRDDTDNRYRINVDGISGRVITMTDIRPGDSVFVFVEAALPDMQSPGTIRQVAHIDFVTSGAVRSVPVVCDAVGVKRVRSMDVLCDTVIGPEYPYIIYDSLHISAGATLRLLAGAELLFHDKAVLSVDGRLFSDGTPGQPVVMSGDRTGNLVPSIPYDVMSGQWSGVRFNSGSEGCLRHTVVKNSTDGVSVMADASLNLEGCVLRNAVNWPLRSDHGRIMASGCEIAEGGDGVISVNGGEISLDHCTVANYYLFSAIQGAILQFSHTSPGDADGTGRPYVSAVISNSVMFGLSGEMNMPDLTGTGIHIRRCLMKSGGSDDDNFEDCIWQSDPMFHVDRSAYVFDYHISVDSPAANAAQVLSGGSVLSPLGEDVTLHLGAYPPI